MHLDSSPVAYIQWRFATAIDRELLMTEALRLSDWEARLSPEQLSYAAADAYAGRLLFAELIRRLRLNRVQPPQPGSKGRAGPPGPLRQTGTPSEQQAPQAEHVRPLYADLLFSTP